LRRNFADSKPIKVLTRRSKTLQAGFFAYIIPHFNWHCTKFAIQFEYKIKYRRGCLCLAPSCWAATACGVASRSRNARILQGSIQRSMLPQQKPKRVVPKAKPYNEMRSKYASWDYTLWIGNV